MAKYHHSILQLITDAIVNVTQTRNIASSSFVFLFETHLLVALQTHVATIWNFNGDIISRVNENWYFVNTVPFTTSKQEIIMVFGDGKYHQILNMMISHSLGCVNILDIFKGKLIVKLNKSEYLQDTSVLHFNDETNELYSGNMYGKLFCWSN